MTEIRVCHASTEESSTSLSNSIIERTTAQVLLLNLLQTCSRPLTDHPACSRHFSRITDHQRGTTSKAHSLVESQYVVKRRSPSLSLELPLELRIMVYNYAISNQELNITQPHRLRRSTALLHTNLQMTREIYQFCPVTAVIEISAPLHGDIYSAFPGHNGYLCFSYHGDKVFRSMKKANRAVTKFCDVDCRRQLTIKVRI